MRNVSKISSMERRFFSQGHTQDLAGRGQNYFFQIWKFACRKALLEGFRGMPSRVNFLKWCNFVRFGVYLDQILYLKNFKNHHFMYKFFKNYHFLYKK